MYRNKKYVIVGGNAAGMSAAMRIRKNDPKAIIKVVQKEDIVSYASCGFPYFLSGEIQSSQQLIARSAEFFKKNNIDVQNNLQATQISKRERILLAHDVRENQKLEIPFDKLIIASGASAKMPTISLNNVSDIYVLRHFEQLFPIQKQMNSVNEKKVIIAGSGYLGLELAEAFQKKSFSVTIVDQASKIMPYAEPEISQIIETELLKYDCRFYTNNSIIQLEKVNNVNKALLKSGPELDFSMLMWVTGIQPNVQFAKDSGIQLGKSGAISVSPKMETNLLNIYAAGDCTEVKNLVSNKYDYIPLGTTANKQGRVAGDNASGRYNAFNGVLGTSVVKVFDKIFATTGLTFKQALDSGFAAEKIVIESSSKSEYFPGNTKILISLIFSKENGKLLGAQAIGEKGVAKRIDVFATALFNKMTVSEISQLDLTYAPPVAPLWDPVIIAAREANKKVTPGRIF